MWGPAAWICMSLCLYSNSIGLICGGYPQHFDTSTTITNSRSLSFSSSLSSLLSHRSNHVYIWWTNRGEERRLGGAKPPSGEFSPPPKHHPLSSAKFLCILSLVSNLAPPELQMLQRFQLQGALPPDPSPGSLLPGTHGGSAPMLVLLCSPWPGLTPPPNVISWPRPCRWSFSVTCQTVWNRLPVYLRNRALSLVVTTATFV